MRRVIGRKGFAALAVATAALLCSALITYVWAQMRGAGRKGETAAHAEARARRVEGADERTGLAGFAAALPAELETELVRYPSGEVAFVCGPQLKSGSALNPFPWFDATQAAHGHIHGKAMPAVAPRTLTGTLSVKSGSTVVTGKGTRFLSEVDPRGPAPNYNGHLRIRDASQLTVSDGGRGYTSAPVVTLAGGAGAGASAVAVVADGRVKAVRLEGGGKGYTSPPAVNFSGGGGAGAKAEASVEGGAVVGNLMLASRAASVDSDARLTLTAAWPHGALDGAQADTQHFDGSQGAWNTDLYYNANYYDTALVQYLNHYRTGDASYLAYARKTADAWWASQWINHGTVTSGPNYLPPRSQAFAGLMLRAMDGRPEMWDYLERTVRQTHETWVRLRRGNPTLYYDIREDGYAQLYAVLLARVLPDSYPLHPRGTDSPAEGVTNDGAAKRAALLRDAEDAAVNFFGRLQRRDGSWRWDVDLAPDPANQFRDIEQPFMVGLYLESVVLLHQLTEDAAVRGSLKQQLTRSVRHVYRDAYVSGPVTELLPRRWRGMFYWYGGGTVAEPKHLEPPRPHTSAGAGGVGRVREVRHLNSTLHHAFGYAYAVTGDEEFREMGDEVFGASYGDGEDEIRGLADSGKAKDYDQNYRASGRYLVWRLLHDRAKTQTPRASAAPAANVVAPVATARPPTLRSPRLISGALSKAVELATSITNRGQVEELILQIEEARRAFDAEGNQFTSAEGVAAELRAALTHARTALAIIDAEPGAYEAAKLRVTWASARLKRAGERARPD